MNPVPYGRQWITEEEIEVVARVLRSGWLTTSFICDKLYYGNEYPGSISQEIVSIVHHC